MREMGLGFDPSCETCCDPVEWCHKHLGTPGTPVLPPAQRDELQRLTENATPGTWAVEEDGVVATEEQSEKGSLLIGIINSEDDRAYIAALSPEVVRALLADGARSVNAFADWLTAQGHWHEDDFHVLAAEFLATPGVPDDH